MCLHVCVCAGVCMRMHLYACASVLLLPFLHTNMFSCNHRYRKIYDARQWRTLFWTSMLINISLSSGHYVNGFVVDVGRIYKFYFIVGVFWFIPKLLCPVNHGCLVLVWFCLWFAVSSLVRLLASWLFACFEFCFCLEKKKWKRRTRL